MKLHLPKGLFIAVLAACVGFWQVSAMQKELLETQNFTFDTSGTFDGILFDYAGGTLTVHGSPSSLSLTFDLDYDKFAAVTEKTDIIYLNTTDQIWGLLATTEDTVAGKWTANNSSYTDSSIVTMSATDLANYATGAGENRVIEDLKTTLQSGNPGVNLTTSGGETVFYSNGLTQGSKTINSATINTELVTSVTVSDSPGYRYTNKSGTWERVLHPSLVLDATESYVQLRGGENASAATNATPIIVGGSGQLHLEAFGVGHVVLDDDIYAGSSSYWEATNRNAADFGVIRISNDDTSNHYTATLSGNIYLVEDSSIKGTGEETVTISGKITDKGVPTGTGDATVDGNYALTIGGAGFNITGEVNLGELRFVQGKYSTGGVFTGSATVDSSNAQVDRLRVGKNTTLNISGNMTVGSTVLNKGTISLTDATMQFNNLDAEHYDKAGATYHTTASTEGTTANNGYAEYDKLLLIEGTVTTSGTNSLSGTGLESWEYVEGTGIVGTLSEGGFDTNRFYINTGTVRLSNSVTSSDGLIYSDKTASRYVVASGAVLDAYFSDSGKIGNDYALVGKTIELRQGAKLINTGGNANSNWQQLKSVVLAGDAEIEATANNSYGFLASNYEESTLDLNGYVLTKSGNGTFTLLNTTVSSGIINITNGTLLVKSDTKNFAAGTNFDNTSLVVGTSGTLELQSMKDAASVSSLLSSTTGSGSIKLNTGGTITLTSQQFSGFTGILEVGSNTNFQNDGKDVYANIILNGGQATLSGNRKINGNLTIRNGSILTAASGDTLVYNKNVADYSQHITIETGGELAMGGQRWSIGNESSDTGSIYQINLAGGKITGTGHSNGNLDFFRSGKIVVTGDTGEISADLKVQNSRTLTVETSNETDSATFSGKIIGGGQLTKTGKGNLVLSGANTYSGKTTISGGKILLDRGQVEVTTGEGDEAVSELVNQTYTLHGDVEGAGTLQVESGTTLDNNSKSIKTALVLNGGHATLKGDQKIQGDITINNGSILTAGGTDVLTYGTALEAFSRTITVNAGGELNMGDHRWSIGRGNEGDNNSDAIYQILMAGGKITRGESANPNGNLDFFDNSKITATGAASDTSNIISADIKVRGSKTLSLITEDSTDALSIDGRIIDGGAISKSGDGDVYLSGDNTYSGGTTVEDGKLVATKGAALGTGSVTVNGGAVQITEGGATVTVEKLDGSTEAASISKSNKAYTHEGGNSISFLKAKVTFSSAEALSVSNILKEGSALINDGAGTVTVLNGYNNMSRVEAKAGDINIQWQDLQGEMKALVVGERRTVGAHKSNEVAIDNTDSESKGSFTLTGTASFGKEAKLYANLTLKSGTEVTLDGSTQEDAVYMGKSTLTLETGLTLKGDIVGDIKSLTPGSGEVVLFTGVDTLKLGDQTYTVGSQVLTSVSGVKLTDYFSIEGINEYVNYYLAFDGSGSVIAGLNVPEPTTATLGLLALAGLFARRRRK